MYGVLLSFKCMSAVCFIYSLGDNTEEPGIEDLKRRAKNGDSKAQTEVRITHKRAHVHSFVT